GSERLLLDHRGDDQHVVRCEVLLLRKGEIDLRPLLAEGRELVLQELKRRRRPEKVIGRREEEALEILLRPRPEARDQRATRGEEVCGLIELHGLVALPAGDLGDHAYASGHLCAREPLGEDDAERNRRRWRRRQGTRAMHV